MKTPSQIREMRKHLAKENMRYPMEMKAVPESEWPTARHGVWSSARPILVWRSRNFLAQVYDEKDGKMRISVCRTMLKDDGRWYDNISWDELMEIKRQIGLADHYAVEVLPGDKDIVNVANMRHIWILPEFVIGWKRTASAAA